MRNLLRISCAALLLLAACNKNEVFLGTPRPVITLDDPDGIYTVKSGRTLTVTPAVEHAADAAYSWILDGVPAGTQPSYTFRAGQPGTHYLVFRVTNPGGTAEEELRIDVVGLLPPVISFMVGADSTLLAEAGRDVVIAPVVANGEGASFRWTLDGEPAGSEAALTFNRSEPKDYSVRLRAENEDGFDERGITVRVVERFPGKVYFPAPYYFPAPSRVADYRPGKSVALGRTLVLQPYVEHFRQPSFAWTVDGQPARPALDPACGRFAFTPTAAGDYTVGVRVTDPDGMTVEASVPVRCRAYLPRPVSGNPFALNIFEYTPAPGQFIGEGADFAAVADVEAAASWAEGRLRRNAAEGTEYFLSLGAWGGCIVAGFDHSIENRGGHEGYDFSISGNQFGESSEAGIVWVMQDADGNGLPDDEWYELRGSEYDASERQYALTYYRPAGARMAVQWTDNRGGAGEIPVNSFHMQDTYYPRWIPGDSYTLYGSKLAAKTTVDPTTGNFVNEAYPWGYADNLGTDSEAGANPQAGAKKTYFRIANAVQADGTPAGLSHIDFVKVQTAISHVAGHLGEVSTEIISIEDENR